MSYSAYPIPKNVLLAGPDFDYFDLCVILVLVEKVQDYMVLSFNGFDYSVLPDITLPFREIVKRNECRDSIYERLTQLRRKDIRYRIRIPGNEYELITGLFSRVTRDKKKGAVYVTIQKEAMPWLLALGQGYSYVEGTVLKAIRGVYVMRLYLLICSYMYRGSADFDISIDNLRAALGCPDTDTPSLILRRYVGKLELILDTTETHWKMKYNPILAQIYQAGRHSIIGIRISFIKKEEYTQNDDIYGKLLAIMSKLYGTATTSKNLRPLPDVVNALFCDQENSITFIREANKYMRQYQNDIRHLAHTMFVILKDRFGIDVYK